MHKPLLRSLGISFAFILAATPAALAQIATGAVARPGEFSVVITPSPRRILPEENTQLEFSVLGPDDGELVSQFVLDHDHLFHVYVVSQDLRFFLHLHPAQKSDGKFQSDIVFPRPGLYRVLSEFTPAGGVPQSVVDSLLVSGVANSGSPQGLPVLVRDDSAKQAGPLRVSLVVEPVEPNPRTKTMLFLFLDADGELEKFHSDCGQLLAVSDDSIDLMRAEPFASDGRRRVQFNVYFPRARSYRLWAQFQHSGEVNTAYFDIPVQEMK